MREAMGVLLKSGCPLPLTFTACEWLSVYCAGHSCAVLMAETNCPSIVAGVVHLESSRKEIVDKLKKQKLHQPLKFTKQKRRLED